MGRLVRWLLRLLRFFVRGERVPPRSVPPPKTIVPLLVFPKLTDQVVSNETSQVGTESYYVASPWELSSAKVDEVIRRAEQWLADALGTRIGWNPVREINSQRSLSEWRSGQIGLIKEEAEGVGLPWTDDYIYLAFVRGMGGYAGGIRYENGAAGYAMVGGRVP